MSWSLEITGTKDAVKAKLTSECERIAKGYEGKPEADDIRSFQSRALALIDALELGKDQYTDWNAVTVKGNGSHSTGTGGVWSATMTMSVVRTHLEL